MSEGWRTVPLGELLRRRKDQIFVQEGNFYKRITIRMHGGGVFVRDTAMGAQIGTKIQFLVKNGQFLLSKIDARNGAFGVVPPECNDAVITGNFWTFDVDFARVDIRFLRYLTKTHLFVDFCIRASEGTTNRLYLQEPLFLQQHINLPPLPEQRRIVARIEELAGKIEEARGLRRQATGETEAILDSAMNSVWMVDGWICQQLGTLVHTVSGQVDPRNEPYAGLPHINGEAMQSGTCRLLSYRTAQEDRVTSGKYHFQAGAILYSKIRPYLRKAVQVPFEGICSADVYAFQKIADVLHPRFFMYSLISPSFTEYANNLAGRTRMPKLNQNQMFAYQFAFPPLEEQERIVTYLDDLQAKADSLKALQAQTASELDALLPTVLDKAFKGEL